ncbi:hypothetical protein CC117_05350 [Parafrankia colletiae]|uniref:Uncharacterized protein n=1 Tax=Parafrankia colletiae TaxID=573497 RepID=A0A1S1QN76_9ACTN|nr:hypothetical protein [Parafrankia colletiae]MCK9900046.1 hypothetical protein [Frankia sp. Cpl3]OHV33794.1 hypothetical protein CC117_05350 [Parafrankia colletiae]
MGRPFHVYDYEGEHLGSFPSWDRAHEWAHLQAVLHGVPTPLEVEDRATAGRRRVWAERCEPVVPAPRTAPVDAGRAGGDPVSGDPPYGDPLADGLCAAVSAPVFAPPRPRQPSELDEPGQVDEFQAVGGLTGSGLAEAGRAEA